MADFMTDGLKKAIAEAALRKHLETCGECWDDEHSCAVGDAHRRVLGIATPTASGVDQ